MTRFLNPSNEDINNIEEDLVEIIATIYSYEERAYKTDKEDIMIFYIKDLKAL